MASLWHSASGLRRIAEDVAFYHGDRVEMIRQHPGRDHACDARAENHRMLTRLRHSVILMGSTVAD